MAADDWLIEAARAGMKPSPYDAPSLAKQKAQTAAEIADFYAAQTAALAPRCPICGTGMRRNAVVDVWYCVRCKPLGA